jgi:hypothetical protein
MAGILDEVMDGITAKEKTGQTTPAQQPATQPTQPEQEKPTTQPAGEKPMNAYHDDFKKRYGDKK